MESEAKKMMRLDNLSEDLVAKGFHKVDDHLVDRKAPKINWGRIYQKFTDKEKIAYLEKLCSTMNHAAWLVQGERNQLNELCEKKEEQLGKMKAAMDQNMNTLQTEMTKFNEQRQQYNAEIAKLNKQLRKLNGSKH